jgi:hypothetical protein
MSVICDQRYSTRDFIVDHKVKRMVIEASTLAGPLRDGGVKFSRIYSDAIDSGIILVSHKTDKATVWLLDKAERDADGDITVWVLEPTTETLRKHPNLRGWEIHILND